MKVKLEYFKESGKWYTDGEYESQKKSWHEAVEEVKFMMDSRTLPDLVPGASGFIVHVYPTFQDGTNVFSSIDGPPHLLLPDGKRVDLRYDVLVSYRGRWELIASCLTEDDARAIAYRRSHLGQSAKIKDGDRTVYERA